MAALQVQDDQAVGRIARTVRMDDRSAKRGVVFLRAIGWVTAQQHSGDPRRTMYVRLTSRGRDALGVLFDYVERPPGIMASVQSGRDSERA